MVICKGVLIEVDPWGFTIIADNDPDMRKQPTGKTMPTDQIFQTYEKLTEGLRSLGLEPPSSAYFEPSQEEVMDRSRVLRRVPAN